MNSFIRQALLKQRIEMFDLGQSMRTYCYLIDAIEMCFVALGKGKESIYNVGGVSRIRIIDLAKLICDLTGSELISPLSDTHGLKGAPSDVWLDIRKITDLSKKRNFIEIEEGVKRTINWQKKHLY
jgi:nucleoside-diphosphate-sugar epimerase